MFPHRLGDEEYTVPHHESPPRDSRYFDAQPALAQQQPLPIPVPWHYNNQASHQIPPFHRSHSYPSPVHPPPPIHSITDFAVESSLFSHSAGWQPAPLPPPQPLPLSSSVPSYSAASYTPFTPYSAPEQPPWPPSSSSSFTTTPYAARPSSTPSSNEAQPRTHIDHESSRQPSASSLEASCTKPFILKLSHLLSDSKNLDVFSWDEEGNAFFVHSGPRLDELLLFHFGHSNVASFTRQLNVYGFARMTAAQLRAKLDLRGGTSSYSGWSHPLFRRGEESKLPLLNPRPSRARLLKKQAKLEAAQSDASRGWERDSGHEWSRETFADDDGPYRT